ncbi:hypothetical protein SH668x_000048 [Planctomicrobium sp. SH668]|uniref:hypothetical protein n=1 Tax=Planctomicrobium sp. SH668 TaxID=3448126 RepID=UPI003F5CA37E
MNFVCTNSDCDESAQSTHFYYRLDADGCDRVFDIISKKTGEIVARMPFWDLFQETRFDTLLIMAALDRFVERGGFLQRAAISKALAVEYDVTSGSGEYLKTVVREDD